MPAVQLDLMRHSGRILAEALEEIINYVRPGISSFDISNKLEEIILSYDGALPAFKGYKGFPEAACVSVNEEVVHAVPKKSRILGEQDIVSIDCGVIYKGHFSDACRTKAVGDPGYRAKKLIDTTKKALDFGIAAACSDARVGDISYAIQRYVERKGFSVNLDYTGHGIGLSLHLPPCVPNYGPPGRGALLYPGMCLAIEPVVFDGPTDVLVKEDRWTSVSREGNLSAHFEDTIIVTESGPEIITRLERSAV